MPKCADCGEDFMGDGLYCRVHELGGGELDSEIQEDLEDVADNDPSSYEEDVPEDGDGSR
jgi:hypothetical protein